MIAAYKFETTAGAFWIRRTPDGRWSALFQDEALGNYATPGQASDDLAGGHTFSASCGDTSVLGLPSDLNEWTPVPPL